MLLSPAALCPSEMQSSLYFTARFYGESTNWHWCCRLQNQVWGGDFDNHDIPPSFQSPPYGYGIGPFHRKDLHFDIRSYVLDFLYYFVEIHFHLYFVESMYLVC